MLSSYLSKNIFITRILPVFALGIIIGFIFPTVELLPYHIALIFLSLIFLITKEGYLVSIFFLLFGFTIIQSKLNTHCYYQDDKESIINGTIITRIQQGKKSKHFIIETNKGLRINVYLRDKTINLKQNDNINLQASIYKIENHINSSFNYKRYMKTQYCTHFCFAESIKLINQNKIDNSIPSLAKLVHKHLAESLLSSKLTHETSSIISAMLIGERSQIEKETKENYIKAGAIHILAISGLHTGIVFLLVKLLLCKIFKMREYSYLFMLLSLACLWTYALITNLPTSVLRACIIISFIIIAKSIKRDCCIYNSIGASAFIILIYDPASLFTPGFQLSYSAYTSIIYFFPKIKNLLNFKNKLITRLSKKFVLSAMCIKLLQTPPLSSLKCIVDSFNSFS